MTNTTVTDGQRSISLHEVILQRLNAIDSLYRECGDWTTEEYAELVNPLHEALRNISANSEKTKPSTGFGRKKPEQTIAFGLTSDDPGV